MSYLPPQLSDCYNSEKPSMGTENINKNNIKSFSYKQDDKPTSKLKNILNYFQNSTATPMEYGLVFVLITTVIISVGAIFSVVMDDVYRKDGLNISYISENVKIIDKDQTSSYNRNIGQTNTTYFITLDDHNKQHSEIITAELFNKVNVGDHINAKVGIDTKGRIHFKEIGVDNFTD